MDKCTNYVGEVGQSLQITYRVPVGCLNPIVGVGRLGLSIKGRVSRSLEEEVVLFKVNLFKSDCHHESEQKLILLEESSAGVSVNTCFEFISNSVKLFIKGVVKSWFLDVVFDGLLEEIYVGIQ